MCISDPNAAARDQARARDAQRKFDYQSKALKFHNKETSFVRGKDLATIGLSRQLSDYYTKALFIQGKGRQKSEAALKKYAIGMKGYEGGRSKSSGRNYFLALAQQQAQIENTINATFGRNQDIAFQGAKRNYMSKLAKGRESLGIAPSEFGPPTMLPGVDRNAMLMQGINLAMSVAGMPGFGAGGEQSLLGSIMHP